MKNRIISPTLWVSFLLLFWLITGCASLREPQLRGVENFRLLQVNGRTGTLLADVLFENPNKMRLRLLEAEGDAWLNGNYLGRFRLDSARTLYPETGFRLPVRLEIDLKKILGNSLSLILNPEAELEIKGKVKAGKGILRLQHPFQYKGKENAEKWLESFR